MFVNDLPRAAVVAKDSGPSPAARDCLSVNRGPPAETICASGGVLPCSNPVHVFQPIAFKRKTPPCSLESISDLIQSGMRTIVKPEYGVICDQRHQLVEIV